VGAGRREAVHCPHGAGGSGPPPRAHPPGVGAARGAFVTVPCNVAVLLDVPKINITLLTVQGLLRSALYGPSLYYLYCTLYSIFIIVIRGIVTVPCGVAVLLDVPRKQHHSPHCTGIA